MEVLLNKVNEIPNSALQKFWLGKLLQSQWNQEIKISHQEIEKKLHQKYSSLSEGISNLVCFSEDSKSTEKSGTSSIYDSLLNDSWILNWKNTESLFSSLTNSFQINKAVNSTDNSNIGISDDEELLFKRSSLIVKEIALQIHSRISTTKEDLFISKFEKYMEIASYFPSNLQFQSFLRLYHKVVTSSNRDPNMLLVGSILTSNMERFLGDVYVSILLKDNNMLWNKTEISEEEKLKRKEIIDSCPRMLKDLLVSPILISFFGDFQIFFLRNLIGPPTGLNIRNILWHGFISYEEFPICYLSLLFILYFTLCTHVSSTIPSYFFKRKQKQVMNHVIPDSYDFGFGSFVLPEKLQENEIQEIERIINRSYFPVNCFHSSDDQSSNSVVIQAFRLFTKALHVSDKEDILQENNFYYSLCLLLPQLEHGLRMVYVAINNLDPKFASAVSKLHYTTLDHFLSETLENEVLSEARKNEVPQEISFQIIECFLDLFTHVAGPRIRDRMSHGECSLNIQTSVNRLITDRVFGAFLYLCIKYNTDKQIALSPTGLAARVVQYFDNYSSCFHPKVVTYKHLLFSSLRNWISLESLVLHPDLSEETTKLIEQQDEEKKWIYQYKNDYESEETELHDLIIEIHANMIDSNFSIPNYDSVVMNTYNTKILDAGKYLHSHIKRYFKTLYRPQTELSKIISISSIITIASQISGMISEKLQTGRKDVIEDKAGRRQQDSLYKLISCLGYLSKMIVVFLIVGEECLLNDKVNNIKYLNNSLTAIQRIQGKLSQNQWAEAISLFSKFKSEIKSRNVVTTPKPSKSSVKVLKKE